MAGRAARCVHSACAWRSLRWPSARWRCDMTGQDRTPTAHGQAAWGGDGGRRTAPVAPRPPRSLTVLIRLAASPPLPQTRIPAAPHAMRRRRAAQPQMTALVPIVIALQLAVAAAAGDALTGDAQPADARTQPQPPAALAPAAPPQSLDAQAQAPTQPQSPAAALSPADSAAPPIQRLGGPPSFAWLRFLCVDPVAAPTRPAAARTCWPPAPPPRCGPAAPSAAPSL